jgi:hypothetical protein
MQRKLESQDLDIPQDDIDCWYRYPKHRWVYELSRLLDAQNIKWSPFEIQGLNRELNLELYSREPIVRQPGFIYVNKPLGIHLYTELYIVKGEIKLMRHIDPKTKHVMDSILGEIELRLNAFITLYFQKFTGVITTETYSSDIFRVCLRPCMTPSLSADAVVTKLVKRIYKRNDILLSGLTDRSLQESLAS